MKASLGIDVSKRKVDVALSQENKQMARKGFANTQRGHVDLEKWLRHHDAQDVHICMEATGRYGDELAHFLYEQAYTVSVVNPSRIHSYAKSKLRRHKNDALDAELIADFCTTQNPEPWHPPSASQRELQELTREITRLKEDRQRKRNKLKSGITSPRLKRSLQRSIDFINQEIDQLEQEITQLIEENSEVKENFELLTSIPSIGFTTATRFLAEVDYTRFRQASEVAAYAGLIPAEHTSGSSVHKKSRMSKIGNRHLRTAFYMPALSAPRFNPVVAALVDRLHSRNKHKMVIMGAVMRKLLHLAFGVLKTRKSFDPQYLHNIPVAG